MPIDSSGPSPGHASRRVPLNSRRATNVRTRLLGTGHLTADRHQAAHVEPAQAGELADRPGQVIGPEPRLGRIEVHVHLEQDRHALHAELAGQPVEPRRQRDGVDGLDDLEGSQRPACLVRLQRPDEVPAGIRHLRDLRESLLDPVLAEHTDTGVDGVAQPLRRHRLGDRDERHRPRVAPDPCARISDPLEHACVCVPERLDLSISHPQNAMLP